MKAPDKIYLQACGDCPGFDSCQSCKFDDLEEVTWAEEKVWEKDIPYIRKEAILEWAKEIAENASWVSIDAVVNKIESL